MILLTFLAAVIGLVVRSNGAQDLESVSVCAARFPNGSLVDLTSLVGMDGRAKYVVYKSRFSLLVI
jgi:hypothetical protein